ncbi:metal-binding protein [Bordetella genomosp. 7]|uniref:Metal-binding protein n=1 Tax=Bordetella genomosp. 7 TaxID=1416805 RepID=A0A261RCX5_9BORD|nr:MULTISPECIES: DUF411 domain-containing protein [Bordetella]OZI22532.1 metal-binding protein [Bordetella genomosp. 7]OZI27032.1 metal-binding protein [Bordetella genomosp. 7]
MSSSSCPSFLTRRRLLGGLALAPALAPALARSQPAAARVQVWKSPTCGCCTDWIAHLHEYGFQVQVEDVPDTGPIRRKLGMPAEYASCHSARVQGYALEGHVPASDIQRLLREQPAAIGLAVPGMPLGSPGMDGPEYQGRKHPYEVLLVRRWGLTRVFQAYT